MNDKDEKPTLFVSRRGRQVGVHEVDMNGIDIDTPHETSELVKNSSKPTLAPTPKKTVVKTVRKRNPWSKWKKMTALLVLAAVLITPIIIAEIVTAQYTGGTTGAKVDMNKLITSTVLPVQKKSAITADEIRNVSLKVNDIASQMCRGGLVDNMAKLYPRAKSSYDECKQTQNKYVSLTTNLYSLETQARYLEKVGTVIKPVSTPITDEFAVIGAQQTMWVKTLEDLKKLNPPNEFKTVHSELILYVTSVADNWSKLNTANGSQDKTGFEEAEKALNTQYEAVRSTSSQYLSILSSTQTNVLKAYNATK